LVGPEAGQAQAGGIDLGAGLNASQIELEGSVIDLAIQDACV
jgi:hypothetical protein